MDGIVEIPIILHPHLSAILTQQLGHEVKNMCFKITWKSDNNNNADFMYHFGRIHSQNSWLSQN